MPPHRAVPPGPDMLDAVETALVRHRAFGDSHYIRDQLAVAYRRRLHTLGSILPEAERLAGLLDDAPPARQRQLLGDTVLRCAAQHAMRQLHLGDDYGLPLPQCAALFHGAAAHLRCGRPGGPLVAHLPDMARLRDGQAPVQGAAGQAAVGALPAGGDRAGDASTATSVDISAATSVAASTATSVDTSVDPSVATSVLTAVNTMPDFSANTAADSAAGTAVYTSVDRSVDRSIDTAVDTSVDISLDTSPDTAADTYIWHAWQEGTPYAAAFLAIMEDNYGAPLATPTPHERALLRRGLRLLDTLLPRLAASALSHVQLIALFPKLGTWRGKASSSQFRVNGSIFLNQELIGNPWWLAEHLLHEALHQKLYDFRHGHSLLAPDYAREGGAKVCSLWNAPDADGNHYWDAHRVLAAFHVYVHLALLCLLAERQEAALAPLYGPIGTNMSGSRRAIDRARYLGEQLQTTTWPELGLAGRQMTRWLLAVLDELDTQRRPVGATVHLLLDLYERQSRKLDTFLAQQQPPAGGTLALQAEQELAMTRAALHMLDRDMPAHNAQPDMAQQNGAQAWPRARQYVLQALSPVAEDENMMKRAGYPQAQALITQLVQQSSRQLAALGALG